MTLQDITRGERGIGGTAANASDPPSPDEQIDVLVIGGGQAGLATGYHLRAAGHTFRIVDRAARVGDSWRQRYDSLRLFTPRSYSALPGLAIAGDPDGFAGRDEFADYLEQYADHFGLPVSMQTGIARLERDGDGFVAVTDAGEVIRSRAVVIANGAFQQPAIPAMAAGLSLRVAQFTPASYQRPAQVPAGTVLVVGDGASGRDIANDLAGSHQVLLAHGKRRKLLPERFLGRSIWWWFDRLGLLTAPTESRRGRFVRRSDAFPARSKRNRDLEARGVRLVPRVTSLEGTTATFEDGATAKVGAVVWATGYRHESTWLAIPEVVGPDGAFRHGDGISPVPGLYFVGQAWQRSRASGIIAGVGDDARYVVGHLAAYVGARSR